jgi:hypothetical protein
MIKVNVTDMGMAISEEYKDAKLVIRFCTELHDKFKILICKYSRSLSAIMQVVTELIQSFSVITRLLPPDVEN